MKRVRKDQCMADKKAPKKNKAFGLYKNSVSRKVCSGAQMNQFMVPTAIQSNSSISNISVCVSKSQQ